MVRNESMPRHLEKAGQVSALLVAVGMFAVSLLAMVSVKQVFAFIAMDGIVALLVRWSYKQRVAWVRVVCFFYYLIMWVFEEHVATEPGTGVVLEARLEWRLYPLMAGMLLVLVFGLLEVCRWASVRARSETATDRLIGYGVFLAIALGLAWAAALEDVRGFIGSTLAPDRAYASGAPALSEASDRLAGARRTLEAGDLPGFVSYSKRLSLTGGDLGGLARECIERGDTSALKVLFGAGLDPNFVESDGLGNVSLLALAFSVCPERGPGVARVLLAAGADPNARVSGVPNCFHAGCCVALVAACLEQGADFSARDEQGMTVLPHLITAAAPLDVLRAVLGAQKFALSRDERSQLLTYAERTYGRGSDERRFLEQAL